MLQILNDIFVLFPFFILFLLLHSFILLLVYIVVRVFFGEHINIILFLIRLFIFVPWGLLYMWKNLTWPRQIKNILTIIYGLPLAMLFLILLFQLISYQIYR